MKRRFSTSWIHIPAMIIAMIGFSSCIELLQSFQKWNKDYYSYQFGAYINGKEFHNSWIGLFHGPNDLEFGFRKHERDSLIMISIFSGGYLWVDENDKNRYDLDIVVALKSSSYTPGDTYFFDGRRADKHFDVGHFIRGEYETLEPFPYVACTIFIPPRENNKTLIATEGQITIGEFDADGHNLDTVYFNFRAEDEDGNVLVVENGYCKQYVERIP